MGTDIHFAVERREPQGWVLEASEDDDWYSDRNYTLFAILGDVRNGRGFAGCDTGDPVEPISAGRGIPADASLDVRLWWAEWEEHSPSWVSARELVAVDWRGNKLTHRGYVDPENFYRFDQWKEPKEWCGDVGGARVQKVTNTEMLRRIQDLEVSTPWTEHDYIEKHGRLPSDLPGVYTQIEWKESWGSAIGSFAQTILAMTRVAVVHRLSLDDVRAVFFFDS